MRAWTRRLLPAFLVLALALPGAAARLDEVLARATANARFAVPAAATGDLAHQHGELADVTPILLLAHGRTLRVEIGGVRALVRGSKALVWEDGVVRARRDQPVAGSNVLFEDLAIFVPALLEYPQISDDSFSGVVVTSAPRPPSVYELLVYTFSPDEARLVGAKYYRYAVNNLVKRARWSDFTQVADQARPQTMVMTDVAEPRTTTLTLAWRARPDLPRRLFTPAGLGESARALLQ